MQAVRKCENFVDFEEKGKILERALANFNKLLNLYPRYDFLPQTMPPFPWHQGGRSYHNLLVDKNNIKVNVWERGAGLTKACGTAACASAVAGLRKSLVNNNVNINFSEGILNIEVDKNDNIFMTGPVSEIKKINLKL